MLKKAKIPPEILHKVKDSINIIELVGEHVVLRKSGANYVGLCPFHSERTPSFSVSENKQLYHCYGCKRGGDLISFVMELSGLSFSEALEELADRAKIALPQNWKSITVGDAGSETEKRRSELREKQALAFKLNRFAAAFYHSHLQNATRAREYLMERGVPADLIQSFYLGSSSEGWDALASHLVAKKAPLELAVELGLIRPSQRKIGGSEPGFYDLFRNRILFPILNLRGKVAGFGGRVLHPEDTPKYLNSPESFIFHKGKLAFGLYQAQKHIREKDEIILVEGYFDVLAMHAAGFQNVVATCGTTLTPDHLILFKRFASRMTLLFDGDRAGIAATERAMEVGLEQGIVLFGSVMPKNMDPDEVLFDSVTQKLRPQGKEQMADLLQQSKALLDTKIEESLQLAGQSPEDKAQALKKIGGWLGKLKDPIGREVRIQLIQKKLGLSRQLIHDAMGKTLVPMTSTEPYLKPKPLKRSATAHPPFKPMPQIDRVLLAGVVLGGEYLKAFEQTSQSLPPGMTPSSLLEYLPAGEFVTLLLAQHEGVGEQKEKVTTAPARLLEAISDVQVRATFTEALLSTDTPSKLKEFKAALFRSLVRNWARFSQRIKLAISDAEVKKDVELQARLMKEYLDVQRKMKEFNNFYDEE
jgi:DNA primase